MVSSAEFGMMVLRSGGDYLKSSENKFEDFYIDGYHKGEVKADGRSVVSDLFGGLLQSQQKVCSLSLGSGF